LVICPRGERERRWRDRGRGDRGDWRERLHGWGERRRAREIGYRGVDIGLSEEIVI
jgi:hypothetical protein